MKKLKYLVPLSLVLVLGACQNDESEQPKEEKTAEDTSEDSPKEAEVHNHDHEGEAHDHDHEGGAHDHDHEGEAHDHGDEEEHDHAHGEMSEDEQKIYDGYFKDEQVKDRDLSDWEGDWQSVYPYLKDGSLDPVMEKKAEEGDKSAKEYKEYYTTGYKTDIEHIGIHDGEVTFKKADSEAKGQYEYEGKEILQYEKGNRGVRFIYKKISGDGEAPGYIQFSDHAIAPNKAGHFHLYMGDDNEALLKEMEHWPTYYKDHLSADDIVHEMNHH
ncbi:ZinT/AdcA family metal-binding protein [Abyssicoccus albus]|uniref:Zinc transport system substrate-binding protein n=1 Tax=Abyssicoccus albus TaxID=1817405 RepID=A0A3N5CGQ1_9BACL|nr:ZinT/AdcA family metal-binding protein [Abyssicoccus albus]RPF56671.1 zinc transport system substrate-binding protein [Abyssicoccus albus]